MFEQDSGWWNEHGADLKIMKTNPNFFAHNPFPVMEFKFSQCPNNEGFLKDIRVGINVAISNHLVGTAEIPKHLSVGDLVGTELVDSIVKLKAKFNKPVVITIDEADQPLLNQMFSEKIKDEKERAEKMNNTIDSFNQFYGKLKDLLAIGIVRLVVVAGHSMIAKSSIYSGILSAFFSSLI